MLQTNESPSAISLEHAYASIMIITVQIPALIIPFILLNGPYLIVSNVCPCHVGTDGLHGSID